MADWEQLPHLQSKLRITRLQYRALSDPISRLTWKSPRWRAPRRGAAGRPHPSGVLLQGVLDWHRATLLYKCAGPDR